MNWGPLFATSSRKNKIHAGESKIALFVWPCLSLTEKQHTINHMIIFNDSISEFYECSIWGFCRGKSAVFSICLDKKKNNKNKLKDLLLFIFRYTYSYRCCDSHFLGFGQYIFPNFRLALIWFCLLVVLKALAI